LRIFARAIAAFTLLAFMTASCSTGGTEQARNISSSAPTSHACSMTVADEVMPAASPSRRLSRVAEQTRQSSVKVYDIDTRVRGSGTYFEFEGRHLVITSAHVLESSNIPFLRVEVPSTGEMVLAPVVYALLDEENDFAIAVLPQELPGRTPMSLKMREDHSGLIGETLVYTGHPASHEFLTIFGQVAGLADNTNVLMHSYAWMGASGSAVFDSRGRLVGILRAVDVNYGPIVPQITEDIVWLSPSSGINLERLRLILEIITLAEEVEGLED